MSIMLRIPVSARLTEQKDMRDPQPKPQLRRPSFNDRPIGAPVVYERDRVRQLRLQRNSNAWRSRQQEAKRDSVQDENAEIETPSP
jgi:hypothetical protein